MNFKNFILTFVLVAILTSNSFGENMYTGDTSAETQTDTLTRGNYSTELIPYVWDKTTAFDGKKSIRVDWDRKQRPISTWYDKFLSMANSPDLKNGDAYTFSFYAKASSDNFPIKLLMKPSAGIMFSLPGSNYAKPLKLTREWKRYSITFTPKIKKGAFSKAYNGILYFRECPNGTVWYDAIQLEKGKTPTPYRNANPMNVGIELNSQDWSNIYFPKEPAVAMLHVDMPHGKKAELRCDIIDYRGKTINAFKRTVTGRQEIKLPLEDNQLLGWFKMTAKLLLDGRQMSCHSVNYIRIHKPLNIVPEIQPFAGIDNENGFDYFGILKKIGVKRIQAIASWRNAYLEGIEVSPGKFDWTTLEWQLKRGKKFGMLNKVIVNPFAVPDWYLDKNEKENAKKTNSALVLDCDKHEHWRKFIGELIRRYGDLIDEIELGAEDNGQLGVNQYYISLYPDKVKKCSTGRSFLVGGKPFDDLCAMVKIGAEEIRKTHPNMKIGAIRPSRSQDIDDLLFLREMFKKVGKDFNILPVDFYFYPFFFGPLIQQRRAKSDGLIDIYNDAKKITQKWGCDQPIYMSEFGWAPDSRFPDESIYRQEQAETMQKDFIVARIAGYYAFDWYKGFGGISVGNYNWPMQQNMKIQSIAATYSAVARVVENVMESKWLKPDETTRIAVMHKHDGRGVAAVWADNGYELKLPDNSIFADVADYIFGDDLTITDLMGNQIEPKNGQLDLGRAPIYIWHDDYEKLNDIIARSKVEMAEFCDIKFHMLSKDTGRIQLTNRSNVKRLKVDLLITVNKSETAKTLEISKGTKVAFDIKLSGNNVKVNARKSETGNVIEKNFKLNKLTPIPHGANAARMIAEASSRDDIIPPDPWVPWQGPNDLSVLIISSWDEQNLYVKIKVKDDKHFNNIPEKPWTADSIQVAIDPKNDGAFYVAPKNASPLGSDDLEFGLALGDDGKSYAIKSYGPNIFNSDNYFIIRDEKTKTTVYELRLPWTELGVKPFIGMVFGMSFVIFDDDTGNGQNYYIPIGGGIAGNKNPELYKKFILAK